VSDEDIGSPSERVVDLLHPDGVYLIAVRRKEYANSKENRTSMELPPMTSKNAEFYINRAKERLEHGEDIKAMRDCAAVLKLNPVCSEAYYCRAKIHYKREDYRAAIKALMRAIEIKPDYHKAYNLRGNGYARLSKCQNAVNDYDGAVALTKGTIASYYVNRAAAKYHSKDYEDAASDCTEALTINPIYADALFIRGMAKQNLKKYDEAIDDFTETVRLKPDDAKAYFNRALTWQMKGEFPTAIQDYQEGLKYNTEYYLIYHNLGFLFEKLGKTVDAIKMYTEAIRLGPEEIYVFINRAHCFYSAGDYENASKDMIHIVTAIAQSDYKNLYLDAFLNTFAPDWHKKYDM